MKKNRHLNRTLPSVKIEEKDFENIHRALDKFNENAIVDMSVQGFRRLSYKILIQLIFTDSEIPISFNQ